VSQYATENQLHTIFAKWQISNSARTKYNEPKKIALCQMGKQNIKPNKTLKHCLKLHGYGL
jgi:hypothetical protein